MAEIIFRNGDLIRDSTVDVICHQTNCQAVMGAGIAKQIHSDFPRVYNEYVRYCRKFRKAGYSPLGRCQLVWTDDSKSRLVANLFGQEYYGRNRRQTDYGMLRLALNRLAGNRFIRDGRMTLGFPYLIGCGLDGGDWNIVLQILEDALSDYPYGVEIWKL